MKKLEFILKVDLDLVYLNPARSKKQQIKRDLLKQKLRNKIYIKLKNDIKDKKLLKYLLKDKRG